jgi:hypothetical protein
MATKKGSKELEEELTATIVEVIKEVAKKIRTWAWCISLKL